MTEIVININNDSIIPSLKKILKALTGVVSVKTIHKPDTPYLEDPQTGEKLNDRTMSLIQNIEDGKEPTFEYDSIEELAKDLDS